MKIRYLFNENMDPRFAVVLARHYPQIDVLYVGVDHAPPLAHWIPIFCATLNRPSVSW